ncbi:putative Fe-S cluster-containing protein [Mariprofundus aestuarium]|uniref:Putative Fe-S cluster-containing protein n=1 Tax=Mariprofundus aestuarium TaxID=1921086 RepID=A0A2K8KWD9_MARES|nr:(Fe-S)-binding protein [Mariprofundus aestuarium]ATX79177.1 putative Fe-S cluster-containing protein [Mariprofundus aestuarium]
MAVLIELLDLLERGEVTDAKELSRLLPGKNCGMCGFKSCEDLAAHALSDPQIIKRCIHLIEHEIKLVQPIRRMEAPTWKDILDREYDFILDQFDDEPGPREHILLGNPANMEKLKIKKGDMLFGRPAMSVGCPVTHCGVVMEEPDYFNGALVWCITGPMGARENGREIGFYHILAYEGMVIQSQNKIEFGRRYNFLPRYCMLQARHSGLINMMIKTEQGYRVRLEGISLG